MKADLVHQRLGVLIRVQTPKLRGHLGRGLQPDGNFLVYGQVYILSLARDRVFLL
jgi:hypothetical protein